MPVCWVSCCRLVVYLLRKFSNYLLFTLFNFGGYDKSQYSISHLTLSLLNYVEKIARLSIFIHFLSEYLKMFQYWACYNPLVDPSVPVMETFKFCRKENLSKYIFYRQTVFSITKWVNVIKKHIKLMKNYFY